ncbi:MAG: HD domain-containing phosphohydrolase [Rhodocyclaceae bacterium]
MLLVRHGAIIAGSLGNPSGPIRVFCLAGQAVRISDVDPLRQIGRIGDSMARIAVRLAGSEHLSARELTDLALGIHDAWALDADACLGFARLHNFGRPSIGHLIHSALLVAELAAADSMPRERIVGVIGSALTMNVAKLGLHDKMHASLLRPGAGQIAEMRSHPLESVRLLERIGQFDPPWLNAVGSYHENIDGSGYPHALKGAAIALPARMLRVADTLLAARLGGRQSRRPLYWNIQRTDGTANTVQHLFGQDQQQLDPALTTRLVGALGRFPPGSLVRLKCGELAVVARRTAGGPLTPRAVLALTDARGLLLPWPQRRLIAARGHEIRAYANDESARFAAYDWSRIWGYGGGKEERSGNNQPGSERGDFSVAAQRFAHPVRRYRTLRVGGRNGRFLAGARSGVRSGVDCGELVQLLLGLREQRIAQGLIVQVDVEQATTVGWVRACCKPADDGRGTDARRPGSTSIVFPVLQQQRENQCSDQLIPVLQVRKTLNLHIDGELINTGIDLHAGTLAGHGDSHVIGQRLAGRHGNAHLDARWRSGRGRTRRTFAARHVPAGQTANGADVA